MKKNIIVGIAVCLALMVIFSGAAWGIKIYQREQDPNWQLAKKLYNVESALQEIDEKRKLAGQSRPNTVVSWSIPQEQ